MTDPRIAVIGNGRMGQGISLAFALSGYDVALVDSEPREENDFSELAKASRQHLRSEMEFLHEMEVLEPAQLEAVNQRIRIVDFENASAETEEADFVFEAVVEVLEVKRSVYNWLHGSVRPDTVISSTTSTMSANDLAAFIENDGRFVNAHWLNPAYLIPLVEVSPADSTPVEVSERLIGLLESIGKVPVLCKPSPGFIVARIQALALNEAARIVEEGVASAEDVDKAIRTGFGIRYATQGLLEFIDFGGGDVLFNATSYLARNIDEQRFAIPDIVRKNMEEGRNGLRDGKGFYNWGDMDVEACRRQNMADFVRLLQHRDLMPKLKEAGTK